MIKITYKDILNSLKGKNTEYQVEIDAAGKKFQIIVLSQKGLYKRKIGERMNKSELLKTLLALSDYKFQEEK